MKDRYREETNKDVYPDLESDERCDYTNDYVHWLESLLSEHPNKSEQGNYHDLKTTEQVKKWAEQSEEWIRPTSKQLIDICILFEDGRVDAGKLADMLAPIEFILDRLFENGDVTKPSSKEKPSNK